MIIVLKLLDVNPAMIRLCFVPQTTIGIKVMYNSFERKEYKTFDTFWSKTTLFWRIHYGWNQINVFFNQNVFFFSEEMKNAHDIMYKLIKTCSEPGQAVISVVVYLRNTNFSINLMTLCLRNKFTICEQQRRRSACASAQSDQRLCCSLPNMNTATVSII